MKAIKKINSKNFTILIFTVLIFLISIFPQSIINVKAQNPIPITVQEAYDMINNNTGYPDLIVLDVRRRDEYDAEHICNAILIPVTELESRISELMPYNETEIIVYCGTGARSAQASQILVDHNFTKVFDMQGGISAWISAGYETCGLSQPIIHFSFHIYLIIFLGICVTLTVFLKKKKEKIVFF